MSDPYKPQVGSRECRSRAKEDIDRRGGAVGPPGDAYFARKLRLRVHCRLEPPTGAVDQRKFDAVVLDPQSSSSRVAELISRINESDSDLIRRVVLITEEGKDSVIGDLAERYSLTLVQRKFLLQQLWGSLESLFYRQAVFQNVAQMARLISDSFRDPRPAGVRAPQNRNRRLLYASGSLRVDLSVEPGDGSNRIALTGQILDSAKRDRSFAGVPVKLNGWKGPSAQATAGEFGEFHFDFNFEPIVSLEIRIAEDHCIAIPLPALERPVEERQDIRSSSSRQRS